MTKKNARELVVNLDHLVELVARGSDLFLTPDAEKAILELYAIQSNVEYHIEALKEALAVEGERQNPNFTSIKGDNVSVGYRQYGGKYGVDESLADQIPEGMVKTKITRTVDTKEVDKWADHNDGLPLGIVERARAKTISISISIKG